MFFPLQAMIKLTLLQWAVLLVASFLVHFTALLTIKMMQKERVSISMVALCATVTLLTTHYVGTLAYLEGALVLLGLIFLLYKEYGTAEVEL